MVENFNLISIFLFIIILIINVGIIYHFVEMFLSLLISKRDIPKLSSLSTYPSVAILYVTCGDAIPELIRKLGDQSYPSYKIFILDDSMNIQYLHELEKIEYTLIQRGDRTGYKAGSINNWLNKHAGEYDYFIIADSDSSFENDFIFQMILYGEHPINQNVAIFQSKTLSNNLSKKFPRVMGISYIFSMYIHGKLGNDCLTVISWGHNNLHRTRMILDVKGFDEKYIAEDYATGIKLLKKGYECKIVDIISYEYEPETMIDFSNRYIRWAKQTIQLMKINQSSLHFSTQLYIFIGAYSYIVWPFYLIGIIISLGLYSSSIYDCFIIFKIISNGLLFYSSMLLPFVIMVFYFINYFIIRVIIAYKNNISLREYFLFLALNSAFSSYILYPIMVEILHTFKSRASYFPITKKITTIEKMSFFDICNQMKPSILLNIFILFGILKNPVFFLFNFLWIIPMIFSPIIIYSTSNNKKSCD